MLGCIERVFTVLPHLCLFVEDEVAAAVLIY